MVGVDLVSPFDNACVDGAGPTPVTCSVTAWTPDRAFDLITCVHGLHYVGDKLAVLTRAAGWLTAGRRPGPDRHPAARRAPRRPTPVHATAGCRLRLRLPPEKDHPRRPSSSGAALHLPRRRRPGRCQLHRPARSPLLLPPGRLTAGASRSACLRPQLPCCGRLPPPGSAAPRRSGSGSVRNRTSLIIGDCGAGVSGSARIARKEPLVPYLLATDDRRCGVGLLGAHH